MKFKAAKAQRMSWILINLMHREIQLPRSFMATIISHLRMPSSDTERKGTHLSQPGRLLKLKLMKIRIQSHHLIMVILSVVMCLALNLQKKATILLIHHQLVLITRTRYASTFLTNIVKKWMRHVMVLRTIIQSKLTRRSYLTLDTSAKSTPKT